MSGMRTWFAAVVVVAGCGGGDDGGSGEVLLGGDITFSVGNNYSVLAWGVAVPADGSSMGAFSVIIGDKPIDCSDTLGTLQAGEYVTFDPTSLSPMVYDDLFVGVIHTTSTGYNYNGANGHVEITSIGPTSIMGSILHMSDTDDGAILVNGTFEVTRCF